jgi:S1-C subfamily serine protease
MKIENEPAAYGFLAALLVLLIAALALGCVREARGRDAGVAMESAVHITIMCVDEAGRLSGGYGSGTIVNDRTVLTAAHIAEDDPGEVCVRRATMVNGKSYLLAPGVSMPDRDLASLVTVDDKFAPTYPVVYGLTPAFGSRVCSMTAHPRFLWRCGDVQRPAEAPGDLTHTIVTEGGNSGSGVYDTRGRLVGIITHRWSCQNGQLCGGKLATLTGYVDRLLG